MVGVIDMTTTIKDLCNQLIAEGVCPGRERISKLDKHKDICIKVSKCPILDEAIEKRWHRTRK